MKQVPSTCKYCKTELTGWVISMGRWAWVILQCPKCRVILSKKLKTLDDKDLAPPIPEIPLEEEEKLQVRSRGLLLRKLLKIWKGIVKGYFNWNDTKIEDVYRAIDDLQDTIQVGRT